MDILAQQGINVLMLWSVYALVSIGLSLIFGIMKIVNFAHAQFYMVGAFVAYVVCVGVGLSFWLALPVAFLVTAALGILAERVLIRPVGEDELRAMTSTLGLLLAMGGIASFVFGPQARYVGDPTHGSTIGVSNVPTFKLIIALVTAGSLLMLYLFLRSTWLGRAIRATAMDVVGARLQGIDVSRTRSIGFAIGTGLAGLAGALVVPTASVTPMVGDQILLKMFIILVLGGLGTLLGAAIGSLCLALIETVGVTFFGQLSILAVYVLVMAVLIFRPSGLVGTRA